jgi:hypothetical protein
LEPYLSYDDVDNDIEELGVAYLKNMGELVFHALRKKKIACSNFFKILDFSIESTKLIEKWKSMRVGMSMILQLLVKILKKNKPPRNVTSKIF